LAKRNLYDLHKKPSIERVQKEPLRQSPKSPEQNLRRRTEFTGILEVKEEKEREKKTHTHTLFQRVSS